MSNTMLTPNDGELLMLESILSYKYIFNLYKNDHTPSINSTISDFTVADFVGYKMYTIEPLYDSGWIAGSPYLDSNTAVAEHEVYSWTCTSTEPQTLYGYFITNLLGQAVLAERFDTQKIIKCCVLDVGFKISLSNEP